MNDLIEALTILAKYGNPYSPTHCEHDVLTIMIDPLDVTDEDLERLDALGINPDFAGEPMFSSFRFGSA